MPFSGRLHNNKLSQTSSTRRAILLKSVNFFRFHSSLSKLYTIHTTQYNYKYVSVHLSTTSASFIYAELATVTIRIANPSI